MARHQPSWRYDITEFQGNNQIRDGSKQKRAAQSTRNKTSGERGIQVVKMPHAITLDNAFAMFYL